MKTRGSLLGLALLLASCAFSSEAPLFGDNEAAHPIADGGRFIWRDSDERETHDVTFRRTGESYSLNETGRTTGDDMNVMFVPVRSTPEDDYIAQIRLSNGDGIAYAFMWHEHDGYRAFASPGGLRDDDGANQPMARVCEVRSYNECRFHKRGDVLAYYREILYPGFVHGRGTPASYIELTPYRAAGPAPTEKPSE
jgi:hypothetical protein